MPLELGAQEHDGRIDFADVHFCCAGLGVTWIYLQVTHTMGETVRTISISVVNLTHRRTDR